MILIPLTQAVFNSTKLVNRFALGVYVKTKW
jgi:hypothetical protein